MPGTFSRIETSEAGSMLYDAVVTSPSGAELWISGVAVPWAGKSRVESTVFSRRVVSESRSSELRAETCGWVDSGEDDAESMGSSDLAGRDGASLDVAEAGTTPELCAGISVEFTTPKLRRGEVPSAHDSGALATLPSAAMLVNCGAKRSGVLDISDFERPTVDRGESSDGSSLLASSEDDVVGEGGTESASALSLVTCGEAVSVAVAGEG